jgi:hypothetical protein
MKGREIAEALFGIILLALLFFFINEQEQAKRKDEIIDKLTKENEELKQAYLSLLEEFLKNQPELEPSILRELQFVKSEIDELDTPTHLELDSVVRHVVSKEYAKAVRDLAKILEVKLKHKVKDDESFKKQPKLHFLLEHARKCKWITEQEFHNALQIKTVRNEESHELAVNVEAVDAGIMVFSGIKVLYAVARKI